MAFGRGGGRLTREGCILVVIFGRRAIFVPVGLLHLRRVTIHSIGVLAAGKRFSSPTGGVFVLFWLLLVFSAMLGIWRVGCCWWLPGCVQHWSGRADRPKTISRRCWDKRGLFCPGFSRARRRGTRNICPFCPFCFNKHYVLLQMCDTVDASLFACW